MAYQILFNRQLKHVKINNQISESPMGTSSITFAYLKDGHPRLSVNCPGLYFSPNARGVCAALLNKSNIVHGTYNYISSDAPCDKAGDDATDRGDDATDRGDAGVPTSCARFKTGFGDEAVMPKDCAAFNVCAGVGAPIDRKGDGATNCRDVGVRPSYARLTAVALDEDAVLLDNSNIRALGDGTLFIIDNVCPICSSVNCKSASDVFGVLPETPGVNDGSNDIPAFAEPVFADDVDGVGT